MLPGMQSPRLSQQWRYLQHRDLSRKVKEASKSLVSGIRVRLDLRKFLVGAMIVGGLVGLVVWLFPTSEWSSLVTLKVRVTVQDRETKERVPAKVMCKLPGTDLHGRGELDPARFDEVLVTAATDTLGQAEFTQQFACRGTTSIRGKRGCVVFDESLRVEAAGYRDFEAPLAMLVTEDRSFREAESVAVTVMLYRK